METSNRNVTHLPSDHNIAVRCIAAGTRRLWGPVRAERGGAAALHRPPEHRGELLQPQQQSQWRSTLLLLLLSTAPPAGCPARIAASVEHPRGLDCSSSNSLCGGREGHHPPQPQPQQQPQWAFCVSPFPPNDGRIPPHNF